MKKAIKILLIAGIFLALPLLSLTQNPPHPNGGNSPTGGGNTAVGGGAPLGGGLLIMLALAAGYGSRKVYDFRKKCVDRQ